jgi:dipeptidase E
MISLHLLSTPGDRDIRWVLEACRPHLDGKTDPMVAFLPQASLNVHHSMEDAVRSFDKLARIELIDTEQMDLPAMESIIRKAHVVYISGGNTFLLNHRLHISGLMPFLRKKIQAGLPVVGFSAGMILCGQDILTANDLNSIGTTHFDGLMATSFNFYAHYSGDTSQDDWLSDYHAIHDNPVIMVCDGAYLKVEGRKTTLVRGEAWVLRKNSEKERLEVGGTVVP